MYSKPLKQVFLDTHSFPSGLSTVEAKNRLLKYGKNKLKGHKNTPFILKLLSQFTDIMIIILIIASIVSITIALVTHTYSDLIDGFVIIFIVIANALIGALTETRADNAISALQKNNSPTCLVLRDGKYQKINVADIVVGDVISLNSGDIVPADIRLITSSHLQCVEGALTGESVPVDKDCNAQVPINTPISSRTNMCFGGTTIAYGSCTGVVVATAFDSAIGHIASLIRDAKKDDTPLQKSLKQLNEIITYVVLSIATIVFLIKIFISHTSVISAFLTAVALAVGAIPESLPAIITIIMALGVTRLSKKKAIMKRLQAVETLGSTQIICSDKTGTLTQNKMTVTKMYVDNDITSNLRPTTASILALTIMELCNNADLKSMSGDPTELAMLTYCKKYNNMYSHPTTIRADELPFDGTRKLMSTLYRDKLSYTQYTKGAPEMILAKCKYILINNSVRKILPSDITSIKHALKALNGQALRTLGLAYKENIQTIYEDDLIFVGLCGMIDPPRLEAKHAILKCKQAGLKTIMITGDNADTAYAIAENLQIASDRKQVMLGSDLDMLSDTKLSQIITNYSVFARVSPEHKVRIVKALKQNGYVVAMTGDGVNDAPSIKIADIGIGMGLTGTDVTKETADMIVTDDNFATIVSAVEEGRQVFANIQKAVQFLLSTNIVEVLGIFIASLIFPHNIFLSATQLLFINLVTDGLPAFALGLEKAEDYIMSIPPRKNANSVFDKPMVHAIIYQSIIQFVQVFALYAISLNLFGEAIANTMTFIAFSLIEINHAFNVKTHKSLFSSNPFDNTTLNISFAVGVGLTMAVSLIPPIKNAFHLSSLNTAQWLITIITALLTIPLVELYKLITKKKTT